MKSRWVAVLCLWALFVRNAWGDVDFPWAVGCPRDFTVVTQNLERVRVAAGVEGAGFLVLQHGKKVFEHYVGNATPETVVSIASSSKWLAAQVIMSLVDEGKLKLTDRVSQYVPGFGGDKESMTIAHLFAHTSGLPGDEEGFVLSNPLITLEEAARRISTTNLVAPPGTQFAYGGLSMQVGGRVAEVAGGMSWSNLLEKRVKQPLGLSKTTYGSTQNPRIAGGAQSNAREYAAILAMLLNGGSWNGKQVLSPAAVLEMQKDQRGTTVIVESPTLPYGEPYASWSYGVGEWRETLDSHGVARVLSSPGAFGFYPWIDLDRDLAGVLMIQSVLRKVFGPVQELRSSLLAVVDGLPCPGAGAAGPFLRLLSGGTAEGWRVQVVGDGEKAVRLERGYPLGQWELWTNLDDGFGPWILDLPVEKTGPGRFIRGVWK